MSFDWSQLSFLGMVAAPRSRGRWYRDSVMSPGTNLKGNPGVTHGHPGALAGSYVQQTRLQGYFPTNPASSEARRGTGTCGLGSVSGTWH